MTNNLEVFARRVIAPAILAVGSVWGTVSLGADDTPACMSNGFVVGFFNGVLVLEADAANDAQDFRRIKGDKYSDGSPIVYRNFYNDTGGLQDFAETFQQIAEQQNGVLANRTETFFDVVRGDTGSESITGKIAGAISALGTVVQSAVDAVTAQMVATITSIAASPPTLANYQDHQEAIDISIENGQKLILVGHSQGNLFLDVAYDYAVQQGWTNYTKAVHVAPPTSSLRGPYTLANFDEVITALRTLHVGTVPNWTVEIPPFANRPEPRDVLGHGLVSTYLNEGLNTYGRVSGDVDDAFSTVLTPFAPVGQTCMVTGDWIGTLTQPGGPVVSAFTFSMHLTQSDNAVEGSDRISTGSFFANMTVKGMFLEIR